MTAPLVVCSLEAWDEIWRRNQFMIAGLLDRDPRLEVLFVEPSADPINELRSKRRPRTGNGVRTLEEVGSGRLHTFQPTKWLPRAAGPMADQLLRSALFRVVRRLGWDKPNLWVNDPAWAAFAVTSGWPTLYDITDDWLRADRGERERSRLIRNEAELLRVSREVVVCSPELERVKGAQRAVTLIPNAVDVGRMRTPVSRPRDLPDGPVAVYAGTLHEDRLDIGLVVAAAEALDRAGIGHLVLVGPNALHPANTAWLAASRRVIMLGGRPYREIPAYLQHADVLIVPHIVDAFTDSLDPIKLYEYLAAGRPVVSTPVAGFRDSTAETVLVSDGEGFTLAVVRRMQEPWPTRVINDVPDWSDRVAAMATVIGSL